MANLAATPDPGTFRRLVEGEIGVDEYVKSLEERVRDRDANESGSHPPHPEPRETGT